MRLVTDYAAREGVALETLCLEAGVDPGIIQDRDARLPYAGFIALLHSAAEILDDPNIGLHIGQNVQPGYYGPYGFALITCSSVREVFSHLMRFASLITDAYRFELVRQGDEFIRYWRSNRPNESQPDPLDEQLIVMTWVTMARWITGRPNLNARWISFCQTPPADLSGYESAFRCPLRFNASDTALAFDAAYLALPLTQADPQIHRLMASACERLEHQLGTGIEPQWLVACKRAILDRFDKGPVDIQHIVAQINLDEATLRRRLGDHGLSFRKLVEELRRELALSYIQDPGLALVDIAYLTGFSEQSAFHRAFKRWKGMTPKEFRTLQFSDDAATSNGDRQIGVNDR